ncbi:MAG TPA: hypothetical protein VFM05_05240 [Candidatus Saccharimonadales bacterium]|nr:hypothetical protein [Candidatus Saccharimonadales bacterium]
MRTRIPTLIIATILFACLLGGINGQLAYVYKCKEPGTPLEELKEAAAVFIGKVKKVNEDGRARIFEFEVEKYWKGASRKVINVHSGKHIYGSRFSMGQKYLVYAYGEGELGTSRCTRTKSLESATFDLKELGEGKVPE